MAKQFGAPNFDRLPMGHAGEITRGQREVVNKINGDVEPIVFGDFCALNPDNTYTAWTGTNLFAGVAVRNINANLFIDQVRGQYEVGQNVDVIVRGTCLVPFTGSTAPTAGAPVNVVADPDSGKMVATAGSGTAIPNATFTTGYNDGTGVIEITIKVRNI